MQKAKKLLCLALSLFMLLMMFPAGVLAANTTEDDTQAANGKACRIGTTYYDSLPAALVAVQDGDTITLIQDVTTDYLKTGDLSGITLTIDGNGHKWTLDTSAYTNIATNDITIQNVEITTNKAFNVAAQGGKLTFKNCNVLATNFFVRMANNGTGAEVNFDNCTVVTKVVDTMFLLTTDSCGTININDTSLTTTIGWNGDHIGNSTLFNTTNNKDITINVTGTSVLNGAATGNSPYCGIIVASPTGAVTMNLDSTATLRLAGSGTHKIDNRFTFDYYNAQVVLNGSPKLEISAEMARQGVHLPVLHDTGKIAVDYVPSTGKMNHSYYRNDAATTDVTFTPVWTSHTQDAKAAEGYVCKIGDQYYETLMDAMKAVQNNETIVLIADNGINVKNSLITENVSGKTFTIDGDGRKYAFFNDNKGEYYDLGNNNITFKDIRLMMAKGMRTHASGADVNIKYINCDIYNTKGMGFRIHGNDTYDFENTTLVGTQTEPVFLIGDGGADTMTINVKNSYMETVRGIGSGHVGNHSIFLFANSCTGILNITGNSVLVGSIRNTKATASSLITADGGTLTVNVDSTAEFRQASVNISGAYYCYNTASGKLTLNGTPKYTATALALNTGVKLPTLENGDKTLLGVTVGGKLYKAEGTTTVTGLDTGLYTIDPVWVSADTIKTLTGASIRTAAPNGIRFETEISEELIRLLGDNVTFGTLIAPKKYVDDVTKRNGSFVLKDMYDGEYILVPQTKWAADGKTFYAALTGIPDTKEAYEMEFAGRGYYTVTYADGSQVTFYSEFSATDNVRSLYTVAKAAVADGVTDNAMINHIIAVVEGAS